MGEWVHSAHTDKHFEGESIHQEFFEEEAKNLKSNVYLISKISLFVIYNNKS